MSDIISENEKIHNRVAKKYNSKHIEIYNEVEQFRIGNVIKDLLSKFDKARNDIKVLDYGSGTGNLTKFFLQNGCHVTALDISDNSLSLLKELYSKYLKNLDTKKFDGYDIPFKEGYFDIVATYSVLHHIPDYLLGIKDMLRVIKKGGYLYIDHECNENYWKPSQELQAYNNLHNSFYSKVKKIFISKEIFELSFWWGILIRKFTNPKFSTEGDIHVWKDDHIEWDKVISFLKDNGFEIIENVDYLQYHPFIKTEVYNSLKDKINNTKYIIAKKTD